MKVRVIPELCLACGSCTQIAEEVFEIVDDKSTVKKDAPLDKQDVQDKVKLAAESCPVMAIKFEE